MFSVVQLKYPGEAICGNIKLFIEVYKTLLAYLLSLLSPEFVSLSTVILRHN